jgi:hypothetical protein
VISVKLFGSLAMISDFSMASSPVWDRGNRLETQYGIEPTKGM